MLLSLQSEVKMEPALLGDHSDSSHHLSLWGTEDGLPCPRLGVGSQPPEQCSTEDGGPGPEHLMSPGEEVTVPHSSGLLPLSTSLEGGGCTCSIAIHWNPERGSLHDAPPLGLRPADGCTLPGQRTFSPRPRSGQHNGTCERRSIVKSCPGWCPTQPWAHI